MSRVCACGEPDRESADLSLPGPVMERMHAQQPPLVMGVLQKSAPLVMGCWLLAAHLVASGAGVQRRHAIVFGVVVATGGALASRWQACVSASPQYLSGSREPLSLVSIVFPQRPGEALSGVV